MSLEAHGLAFGFASRPLGRGLDLALPDGQALCVLGPNGAGKTTLFRTLLGLIPALEGRITLDGKDIASLSREAVARAVAYVPQSSAMAFDFTLHEIAVMGRTAHLGPFAAPGRRDADIAHQALARFGLGAIADRPFGEVSGGERQLALIARALATEANVMVLDEPTANLDFGNQMRVLAEIAGLKARGIAILLCSHDPGHALEIAEEALLMRDGHTFARGKPADVITDANLSRLYGIEVHYHGPHARPVRPAPRQP